MCCVRCHSQENKVINGAWEKTFALYYEIIKGFLCPKFLFVTTLRVLELPRADNVL